MTNVRPFAITLGACALFFGLDASAQIKAAPLSSMSVTESGAALTTLNCGQSVSRTDVVKNTGGAGFSGKLVLNGVDTLLQLAKDEQKTVTATGGTYDCTKSLSISASIPGSPKALWSKTYDADKITYNEFKTTVNGGDMMVNATTAICGSPMKLYFKFPSGTGAVAIKGTIGSENFTGSINPGGGVYFTSTASLSCAANIPDFSYAMGQATGKLTAKSVSFK